jgi:hypothetical protein
MVDYHQNNLMDYFKLNWIVLESIIPGVPKFSKNTPGAETKMCSKFHTKEPHTLDTTEQNLVASMTWCLGFVHLWFTCNLKFMNLKLCYVEVTSWNSEWINGVKYAL